MAEVRSADGTRLFYVAEGPEDGPVVVFSNGYTTTHAHWARQAETLAAGGARAVRWDYRGHGESESPESDEAYRLDRVIEDLTAVVDAVRPNGPVVLVGLSFGGVASIVMAHRHPDRVAGLFVVSSGPGFKNEEALTAWAEQVDGVATLVEREGLGAVIERAPRMLVGDGPGTDVARAAMTAQDPRGVARFARHIVAKVPNLMPMLPALAMPTQVVVGAQDVPFLRAAEVLAAKIPGASRAVVADAGHMVNLDQPDELDRLLHRFLAGLAPD